MMKSAIQIKQEKALKVKKFFFPFAPIKTFRTLRLLFLIAVLLALRLLFGIFAIKIVPFGLSISLAWIPVMVMGWFFGPVTGLILGIVSDTLAFAVNGGIWFWMYALQEPAVGMIMGFIGSFYRWRKSRENTRIVTDICISQICTLIFAGLSYYILIVWLNPNSHYAGKTAQDPEFYNIYKWVALSCVMVFLVIYETLMILNIKKKIASKSFNRILTFVYTSSAVIFLMLLFSFALGPITAVEYMKFINGGLTPTSYLKYGSMFYLIPRVAVESIKTPIELSVLFGVVCLFEMKINNMVKKINCSWNTK